MRRIVAQTVFVLVAASAMFCVSQSRADEFLGCRFTAKSFHQPGGPCDKVLTGFRIIFADKAEAMNAGYKPCEYCLPQLVPEWNQMLQAKRASWAEIQKQIDNAEADAVSYNSRASEARNASALAAAVSSYWHHESETSAMAAGFGLMMGAPNASVVLAVRSGVEGEVADSSAQQAGAFFARSIRAENAAARAAAMGIELRDKYKCALLEDAQREGNCEQVALLASAKHFLERGDLLNAAMVSGLAWMNALAARDSSFVPQSVAAMNDAMTAFRDRGSLDKQTASAMLLDAEDYRLRGHVVWPLVASYVVLLKYPSNPVAGHVYSEIRKGWANGR